MMNKRKMNKFSDALNLTFGLLNTLTDSEIFESSILPDGNLEITILGRDAEFDNKLECVGSGMWGDNIFIDKLKGTKSNNPPSGKRLVRQMVLDTCDPKTGESSVYSEDELKQFMKLGLL